MEYTSERNHQIIIELLKHHGIKKIVTSPGGTNITFVASVQNDSFFELYSSVDERSAAYIACGLAAESKEPVVLTCTGATASRNYFPGLTEAFYRKLPILAITSTLPITEIGHNVPQVTDRTVISKDIAKHSVLLPVIKDATDEWSCTLKANEAILELTHHGTGPVHINLETIGLEFNEKEITPVHYIDRICNKDKFPKLSNAKKIGIFVGEHEKWSDDLTDAVDSFCERYNGIVIGDHTSNYKGKYSVPASLITSQKFYKPECIKMDLLIHIGNISGAYLKLLPNEVWRVNPDGKICDTFKKLRYVFETEEIDFFSNYLDNNNYCSCTDYYNEWANEYHSLFDKIHDLPFSNIWIAKTISENYLKNATLHLGILNSLRSWNFFNIDKSVSVFCNTGGFGIDGCVSTLLGASLSSQKNIYYGVVGDLAFFYDMNSLGNRHLSNNFRLIVINNGLGQEFKNYGCRAAEFNDINNEYIAAKGHFGNKSKDLIKNYASALGIKYFSAKSKKEFFDCANDFFTQNTSKEPYIFEIFTDSENETQALKIICTLEESVGENAKQIVKNIIGDKGVKSLKKFLKGN